MNYNENTRHERLTLCTALLTFKINKKLTDMTKKNKKKLETETVILVNNEKFYIYIRCYITRAW